MPRNVEDSRLLANIIITAIQKLCEKFNMSLGVSGGKLIIIDHEVNKSYKLVIGGAAHENKN
jgi:hypothetical protein